MNSSDRREKILRILTESEQAVSGKELAGQLGISRQVIVQDMALLRANGAEILSTSQGYMIPGRKQVSRVFKVRHSDEEVEEEFQLIVDNGGAVRDVFVYHKVYGVLKADMDIHSRLDIRKFMDNLASGTSSLLKNITSGYHYHTVTAESEHILDLIQDVLQERGFLAQLRSYEPIDFGKREIL